MIRNESRLTLREIDATTRFRLSLMVAIQLVSLLFAMPCLAEIRLNEDGYPIEFAYATMSDGVNIAVAVGYPKGVDPRNPTRQWPTIFEMSGYGKASRPGYGGRHEQHYVTVSASLRGTGASGGQFQPTNERNIQDGFEIIENWIVQQPWSNGKVGIHGHSWSGLTGFMVASSNPPHLRAVVVSGLYDDSYRGILRIGGIRNIGFSYNWLNRLHWSEGVFGSDRTAANVRGLSNQETQQIQRSRIPMDLTESSLWQLLQLSEHDERWPKSPRDFADSIRAPVLLLHAFQDQQTGPSGVWLFDQLPDDIPKGLVLSNGHHGTPVKFAPLRRAWLDHWLRGEDSRLFEEMDDPDSRVQVFFEVQEDFQNLNKPLRAGDFPLPNTVWRRYFMSADRQLSPVPPVQDSTNDEMADYYEVKTSVMDDEIEQLEYRLRFDEPTAICGPMTVTLWATSTTLDTDFFVVIADVSADGRVQPIQRGMLRASHRDLDREQSLWADADGERVLIRPHHPHRNPQPLSPGKPYQFEIEVFPVGHVFRPGHQLSISISQPPRVDPVSISTGNTGSYQYQSDRPPGEVAILRSPRHPSSLLLPILPDLPHLSNSPPKAGSLMGIQMLDPK